MTEYDDEKEVDGTIRQPKDKHNTERLSKEEIDRLVQGVDDYYFGWLGQKNEQQKTSADESVQNEDGNK